jgi:putative flippase GtrA
MASSIADLRARAKTPGGQKAIRYTLVSVISVVITQIALLGLQLGHISPVPANLIACTIGGVPSYYLNRRWAWGKSGKSHLWKEVVPFWTMNFLGIAISTWSVAIADTWGSHHLDTHLMRSLFVNFANLGSFGVLWIVKFLVFNKFMFVDHSARAAES